MWYVPINILSSAAKENLFDQFKYTDELPAPSFSN